MKEMNNGKGSGFRSSGFKGSEVQRFKGSKVQGFKGSGVQRFRGSKFKVLGIECVLSLIYRFNNL